ncbi:uncharacterized protein [Diabrotica undecimpunctata]|uniref:uncharacterized protein n=1 Tax=Diabrotica undecimpunctata TaxID=50387 RepID=UPI003B640324
MVACDWFFIYQSRNRTDASRASGGVAILVNKSIEAIQIPIVSDLEAVAIRIISTSLVSICNVYLPSDKQVSSDSFCRLLEQLPRPRIILGDFNAHNIIWGSDHTSVRGSSIADILDQLNINFLNDGSPTRFNISTGYSSCIDLTLCDPNLAHCLSWDAQTYTYGSDHFPILIRNHNYPSSGPIFISKWRIKNSNWQEFSQYIDNNISSLDITDDVNSNVEQFNQLILSAAHKFIGKSKSVKGRCPVPWWNDRCATAIRESKSALNRYKKHKTSENKLKFKMLKARAQLTVKTAKQLSWNKYVSEINSNTPLSDVWNKVRKISGLHTSYNFTGLKENNNFITSSSDIANIFGRIYQGHSSNQQYTANFLKAKEFAEQNPIYLFEAQNNSLNHPITFQEINSSILNLKDSSPGPDDIPSAFLKHLPVSAITLENGTPQGSILSPTLFLVAINDIIKNIQAPLQARLYADDLVVSIKGKNISSMSSILQNFLDTLENWSNFTGFQFSVEKSIGVVFSSSSLPQPPNLRMYEKQLEFRDHHKFLGLIFDSKLTWKNHISELILSCNKRLNVLRSLCNKNWGSDQSTLLLLYKSLIRSKLDYGAIAYSTANKSLLKSLDIIHNKSLRLILGAFPTTPVSSIYALLGEPSLHHRRMYLALSHAASVASNTSKPIHQNTFTNKYLNLFQGIRYTKKPYYERIKSILQNLNINFPEVFSSDIKYPEPWLIDIPTCDASLEYLDKSNTHHSLIRSKFEALINKYPDYHKIYTDASKSEDGVGASIVSSENNLLFRLPPACSTYSAELYAIYRANYAIHERVDMVLCIGECLENCLLVSKVYAQKYPDRRHPQKEVFERLLNRFGATGNVVYEKVNKNKPVIGDKVQT